MPQNRRGKSRYRESIPQIKSKFLEHLERSANISEAARLTGIDRGTAYHWRNADPSFDREWQTKLEAASHFFEGSHYTGTPLRECASHDTQGKERDQNS